MIQRREFSTATLGGALTAGLGLSAMPVLAQAQAQGFREGGDYLLLAKPAPTEAPAGKVEVVEFFWYGCPHCYAFEPVLEPWVKKLPADVSFRQVPVAFMAQYQIHQKLFYALEEMGQLPAMHRKVFNAIHQQNKRLSSESEVIAFATASGIDGAKLGESMKSFGVSSKVNRAKQLAEAYKIDGVPALGINGRFYTSASLAGSHERAVAVADFLIQLSRPKA